MEMLTESGKKKKKQINTIILTRKQKRSQSELNTVFEIKNTLEEINSILGEKNT